MKCAIMKKVGMTSIFTSGGERLGVTALTVDGCAVSGHRTEERDGYTAVILGSDDVDMGKLTKPMAGSFAKSGVAPKKLLREFRMSVDELPAVDSVVSIETFAVGDFVDVTGVSIGKGFAGGMKRHGFRGLEASHGVSVSHRSHGSTGGRQDPGKVFKNKKMAGHMGARNVTVLGLKVVAIDVEHNLLFVHGAVPGHDGAVVFVREAIKK